MYYAHYFVELLNEITPQEMKTEESHIAVHVMMQGHVITVDRQGLLRMVDYATIFGFANAFYYLLFAEMAIETDVPGITVMIDPGITVRIDPGNTETIGREMIDIEVLEIRIGVAISGVRETGIVDAPLIVELLGIGSDEDREIGDHPAIETDEALEIETEKMKNGDMTGN